MTDLPLTRADALARLAAFVPVAGQDYGRLRNLDLGPGRHRHVSRLSAALRRRLITEDEVIAAVLAHHPYPAAEKFISEVFWRTYWKGWLESRPGLWPDYLRAVAQAGARLETDQDLRLRHARACAGQTGIDCFDAWVQELDSTGYLHNWARMQLASIWIFTLGLPWELGAAFTLARFVDADPASNTLSWRWVAGLHTAGKAYLSDAGRIAAMTGGRFAPKGLATRAVIGPETLTVPRPMPPRAPVRPAPTAPSLLLLTPEDLSPETVPALQDLPIRAMACLDGESAADRIALQDALARAQARWPEARCKGALAPADLAQAAQDGAQIVTAFAPVGPAADRLTALPRGLPLTEYLRDWDAQVWPQCQKGFFALKQHIPAILAKRGLA
ncbi:deoxyribodipyrimidine photolyase [Rhodobacter capsulatus]|uniref:Deoxyribodipyrimidine photolyase n=1 Tax=Rhodobacter capsulatus TaxID=1061 RepID=A0A4U1JLA0_RHOCA|nr:FAD-binding domain-containing protein [Rhodobacter capsulatus]TKD13827.1 deoxyribodipyrimidine photolyase [Rhodobacter capsulatus]